MIALNTKNTKRHRQRSPLELSLMGWACDFWPEPVDAIEAKWGDWEFERKCLGAIFRKAAATDPKWFFSTCVERPREVLALAPYIREISWAALGGSAAWGSVPGALGWEEYVRSLQAIEGLELYGRRTPPAIRRAEAEEPHVGRQSPRSVAGAAASGLFVGAA